MLSLKEAPSAPFSALIHWYDRGKTVSVLLVVASSPYNGWQWLCDIGSSAVYYLQSIIYYWQSYRWRTECEGLYLSCRGSPLLNNAEVKLVILSTNHNHEFWCIPHIGAWWFMSLSNHLGIEKVWARMTNTHPLCKYIHTNTFMNLYD